MAQKAVRTISVTVGGQSSAGRLASATVYKGSTCESDKIAAFDDPYFTTVPRPVASWDEFSFTIIDDGTLGGLEAAIRGKVVAVTIQTVYGDGKTAPAAVSQSMDMAVTGCSAGDAISVDGARKSTVVIKATPHC